MFRQLGRPVALLGRATTLKPVATPWFKQTNALATLLAPAKSLARPSAAAALRPAAWRAPLVARAVPVRCLSAVVPDEKKPAAAAAPAPAPFDPNKTMGMLETVGGVQRDRSSAQLFASSFLGGAMLSWGSILMMVVAGGAPSLAADPGLQSLLRGMVFPLGLSLIVLSKSELVTANFLTQYLPKPSPDALRVLSVSFAANLAGSLAMVGLASSACLFTPGAAALLVKAASGKAALAPSVAFLKGVGANWLVNLAVFQAASSPTAPGKIAALWLPIMTFITLNLEHSVANMFLLPMASALGAEFTVADMAANIGVVAAGNAAGAVLLVGMLQKFSLFGEQK